MDREGIERALAAEPRAYRYPRISPDGARLALDVCDQENDIWILDFVRETLTRLTFDATLDRFPTWTPDGLQVAFGSNRDGLSNLFWKAADGTGTVERLAESANTQFPQAFSPDGTTLVVRERDPETALNIGVLSMDGDGAMKPLVATEFNELNEEISPDGHRLAYQSDESGRYEIYVRPFPNVDGGRLQISRGGGREPLWGPDGRELFYRSSSGHLTAVRIQEDPDLTFGNPEAVFEETSFLGGFRASNPVFGRAYDIPLDGKRFLMIKEGTPADETEPTRVILIQNWTDELKRLVPVDN